MIGYAEKILFIDLTDLSVTNAMTSDYLECKGEAGLEYDIVFSSSIKQTSPGKSDRLIFACHPVSGALANLLGIDLKTVVSVSPPVSLLSVEKNPTGQKMIDVYWGRELLFSGYDAVIIQGKSEKPVYVLIEDEQVEFRSARSIWDLDADAVKRQLGVELNCLHTKIITVGPANAYIQDWEKTGGKDDNAASLKQLGYKMISMNLKAIVVRGSNRWSQKFKCYVRILKKVNS